MLAMLAIVATACLLVPLYCIYKPPKALIRFSQRRWPDALFHHPVARKVVALTIDDAPSPHTPAILEILRETDASATFFVIGSQVPAHEQLLVDLIRSGNELANHAMHDEPSRALSDTALGEQMIAVQAIIRDAYHTAQKPEGPAGWYFRPGSGFFSTRMRSLVATLGHQLVLGDVYPHDPQVPFAGLNARHILSMVSPGSIIICHDRREWTPPMLRVVLPELKRQGYDIVTVSELLREPRLSRPRPRR